MRGLRRAQARSIASAGTHGIHVTATRLLGLGDAVPGLDNLLRDAHGGLACRDEAKRGWERAPVAKAQMRESGRRTVAISNLPVVPVGQSYPWPRQWKRLQQLVTTLSFLESWIPERVFGPRFVREGSSARPTLRKPFRRRWAGATLAEARRASQATASTMPKKSTKSKSKRSELQGPTHASWPPRRAAPGWNVSAHAGVLTMLRLSLAVCGSVPRPRRRLSEPGRLLAGLQPARPPAARPVRTAGEPPHEKSPWLVSHVLATEKPAHFRRAATPLPGAPAATLRQKYKIQKKVRDHLKKKRRELKKAGLKPGNTKARRGARAGSHMLAEAALVPATCPPTADRRPSPPPPYRRLVRWPRTPASPPTGPCASSCCRRCSCRPATSRSARSRRRRRCGSTRRVANLRRARTRRSSRVGPVAERPCIRCPAAGAGGWGRGGAVGGDAGGGDAQGPGLRRGGRGRVPGRRRGALVRARPRP